MQGVQGGRTSLSPTSSNSSIDSMGAHTEYQPYDITALHQVAITSTSGTYAVNPAQCVGTIQTPRGVGSCVLLANGDILTTLHNIFDIVEYARGTTRSTVNDFFDSNDKIEVYFLDNNHVLQRFEVESIPITGLPVAQDDTRLQSTGWDFAILHPKEDIRKALNNRGVLIDDTPYTYGRSLLTTDPSQLSFSPPHMRAIHDTAEPLTVAASDNNTTQYMHLEVEADRPHLPSTSGTVLFRTDGGNYFVYGLVYTDGSAIYLENILFQIDKMNSRQLTVESQTYNQMLKYSTIFSHLVMKKAEKVFDTLVLDGNKKNTTLRIIDLQHQELKELMKEIRNFFKLPQNLIFPYLKVQLKNIQGAQHKFDMVIIVRHHDKYLAGVELSFNGKETKLGVRLAGYYQVDERYPEDTDYINTNPFSIMRIEQFAMNLHSSDAPSKMQKFFDYFIQVLEISKLPVVDSLNTKLLDFEAKSGLSVRDLINQLKSMQGNYEFIDADSGENIVIPYSLLQIPDIMKMIKSNYAKLITIAKQNLDFAGLIDQLHVHIGSGKSFEEFIMVIICPVLEILDKIDQESKNNLLSALTKVPIDRNEIISLLTPFEGEIRTLFSPHIQ